MFDIGFSELVLLSVIALVVLGPDRLPGALRTAGLWIGRLRRSFNSIKADIEREVGADEIRRQLRNEAIMEKIKNTRTQVTQSIETVKKEAEAAAGLGQQSGEQKEEATTETARPAIDTERPPPPPPPIPPASGDQRAAAEGSRDSAPQPTPAGAEPVPTPSPTQRTPEPVPVTEAEPRTQRDDSGQ